VTPRAITARVAALAARSETPLECFLASKRGARMRQTMLEGLDRIAKLSGKESERVNWAALRYPHTTAIVARLAASSYSMESVRLSMGALRGVLKQANAMGLMSDIELAQAIDVGETPMAVRRRQMRADAQAVARREWHGTGAEG
jgi:hypothetical protein